jgi:hypothetical protein
MRGLRKNGSSRGKSKEIEPMPPYDRLTSVLSFDNSSAKLLTLNMKFRPSLTAQERLALLVTTGLLLLGLAARYAGG